MKLRGLRDFSWVEMCGGGATGTGLRYAMCSEVGAGVGGQLMDVEMDLQLNRQVLSSGIGDCCLVHGCASVTASVLGSDSYARVTQG